MKRREFIRLSHPIGAKPMRRRDIIKLLGGAAATWPIAARAQQRASRISRIGILMLVGADDPEGQTRLAAFLQGLQKSGWTVGQNVRIDTRWGGGIADRYHMYAAELVALNPDVIFAGGGITVAPLLLATRTLPIVFASATDPVGTGLVASLAHPGGNATGFGLFEFGISGKWLELLKRVAPRVTRVAVIRDPTGGGGAGQLGALQGAAAPLGVELTPIDPRDPAGIDRAINAFVRGPNDGLIVPASGVATVHRELIISLAARHRLPTVSAFRAFAEGGGLLSYGPDVTDQYRLAAGYVDRILKGEKPADLPVQAPTKFEMVINLKTAKSLGLTIPPDLLVTADEVIE
jgi:putative tryptophan/tyrosine transport system substrate-binding protein